MRVIGIDPGLGTTGWGVIETTGTRLRHVGDGVVVSDSGRSSRRGCCSWPKGWRR